MKAHVVCEGCTDAPWDIKVKKCTKNDKDFFVYKLRQVPRCPMVYCAGIFLNSFHFLDIELGLELLFFFLLSFSRTP